MAESRIENVNIRSIDLLITPEELKREMPLSDKARASVLSGRETVRNILDGKDHRIFLVLGPAPSMM